MEDKLKPIATSLGIDTTQQGNTASQATSNGRGVRAAASAGDDEEENREGEVDDAERQDTDNDDEFVERGRQSRRGRGRAATTSRGRATTGRTCDTNRTRSAATSRSTAAPENKKNPATKVKQPRQQKLRQSAMPLAQKFKKVGDPVPEPGFAPLESTTEYFNQPPVDSGWVLPGDDPRPLQDQEAEQRGREGGEYEEEDNEQDPEDIEGGAQSNPIPIDSDASDSNSSDDDEEPAPQNGRRAQGQPENGGFDDLEEDEEDDEYNFGEPAASGPYPRDHKRYVPPGKNKPSARPSKTTGKATSLKKGGEKNQKTSAYDNPYDNPHDKISDDEQEDGLFDPEDEGTPPRGKMSKSAAGKVETGKKKSQKNENTTQNKTKDAHHDDGLSFDDEPENEGTPPPVQKTQPAPGKESGSGKKGRWGKKRPSNFE